MNAVILFLFFALPCAAQHIASDSTRTQDSSSVFEVLLFDVKQGFSDGGRLATAPGRFSTRDWTATILVLSGTAVSFTVDERMNSEMQRTHGRVGDALADVGYAYGTYGGITIGAGAYGIGLFAGNDWLRETGRMILEALAYSGILTSILKTVTGRSRPHLGEGAFTFRPWQFTAGRTAFPSGHATMAFATSSVLARRIDQPALSILCYGLAATTMFQRVYDRKHWLSDTVLGAAIGTVVGNAIAGYASAEAAQCTISPRLEGDMIGFTVSVSFF